MSKKMKCYICAGFDPNCTCHLARRLSVNDDIRDKAREKFLAEIWIKNWKFGLIFNLVAKGTWVHDAWELFGPWLDSNGNRNPVPHSVKKLVKTGM